MINIESPNPSNLTQLNLKTRLELAREFLELKTSIVADLKDLLTCKIISTIILQGYL